MLIDSKKDFDYNNIMLPLEGLDIWVGYGQRYGKHRLDYFLSLTAVESYDLFSLSDYQRQEPHDPIYVFLMLLICLVWVLDTLTILINITL